LVPYRQGQLHVGRGAALGDVLMSTPALRELKRRNPSCHVTFYTDYQDLVAGLPFIDLVRPSAESPNSTIWLSYEKSLPPRRHIARILGDHLGLTVSDVRPACVVDHKLVEQFRQDWNSLPRPLIAVSRRAGPWTPNKDWPDEHWEYLVARLTARATVIDVGARSSKPPARLFGSYLDLRGQTTLPQLVAVIAAADLFITPDTGPMHIAAAVETPAVVIYGGYIDPVCTGYPGNINLYSAVECAPCWLREPCPYGKKCLHQITPAAVEAALNQLWEKHRGSIPNRRVEYVQENKKHPSVQVGQGSYGQKSSNGSARDHFL
jgi:ADP-heptose:LPS heptosyltransferase